MNKFLAFFVLVAIFAASIVESGSRKKRSHGCSTWCQVPGTSPVETYCCNHPGDNHYGSCPPLRQGGCDSVFPSTTNVFQSYPNPGSECISDTASCPTHQKCCYDVCLSYRTCKPAV